MRLRVYNAFEQVPKLDRWQVATILMDVAIPTWIQRIRVPELRPSAARLAEFRGHDTRDELSQAFGFEDDGVLPTIASMLETPRRLRALIRAVDSTWRRLAGEVDLLDMVVITALYQFAPDAFGFLAENRVRLVNHTSDLSRFEGGTKRAESSHRKRLVEQYRNSVSGSEAPAWRLIDFLFPAPNSARPDALQGVRMIHPTDYFSRWQRGLVLPAEMSDVGLLGDIARWNNNAASQDPRPSLAQACLSNAVVARKVQHFGRFLLDPYRLTGEYLRLLARDRSAVGTGVGLAGTEALTPFWKLCLNAPTKRPNGWLETTFRHVAPESLRLAGDIVDLWQHRDRASVHRSDGIVVEEWKPVWAAFRDLFEGKPERWLSATDSSFVWTTSRIVRGNGHRRLEDEDLTWLGTLLLEASKQDPATALPQIVHCIAEYGSSVASGDVKPHLAKGWLHRLFAGRYSELLKALTQKADMKALSREDAALYEACRGALIEFLRQRLSDSEPT